MAKKKQNKKVALGKTDVPANNPFAAALAGLSAPVAPDLVAESAVATEEKLPRRVRTRVERKGRGGKTVTLVEGLDALSGDALDDACRRLKKALGVGVSTEGATLVVQGDQCERVEAWFAGQGQ